MQNLAEHFNLSPKQEAALAALLSEPTMEAAAQKAGIDFSTLWRYLQESNFKTAYQELRRATLERAVSMLQHASGEAVTALVAIMKDPQAPSSSRVSAAKSVLDSAFKGWELQDLEVRLQELEAAEEARAAGETKSGHR